MAASYGSRHDVVAFRTWSLLLTRRDGDMAEIYDHYHARAICIHVRTTLSRSELAKRSQMRSFTASVRLLLIKLSLLRSLTESIQLLSRAIVLGPTRLWSDTKTSRNPYCWNRLEHCVLVLSKYTQGLQSKIGSHNSFIKAREASSRLQGKFWNDRLLWFEHRKWILIILSLLKLCVIMLLYC